MRVKNCFRFCLFSSLVVGVAASLAAAPSTAEPPESPATELLFVERYCIDCHTGPDGEADLDLTQFDSTAKVVADRQLWAKVMRRVRNREMPPKDSEVPQEPERARFVSWIGSTLRQAASADGVVPGPARMRRLNGSEYAATIRDLLGIQINAAQGLPADGAGGEGFDNAAETLFISPIHAEKYLDAAKAALKYAFSNRRERSRRGRTQLRFLTIQPNDELTPSEAARQVLVDFLPRALRRPVEDREVAEYMELFEVAYEQEPAYFEALQFSLVAVLLSPKFLFLVEEPNLDEVPCPITDYELASRLSYFLWGSTPDDQLMRLAGEGKLSECGFFFQVELRQESFEFG